MSISQLVRILLCQFLIFQFVQSAEVNGSFFENNKEKCVKVARDPYFDMDIIVNKPWRIYYTWNMNIDKKCLDLIIQNATKEIVSRIRDEMSEYLEQQPFWEAAVLHMTMGSPNHELLLFADQGPAGSFSAIPNVMRDAANFTPLRNGVPLLKFHIKLLRSGKYLLMMDCHVGGASLAARSNTPVYRLELAAEAAALDLGEGFPACTGEKNTDEQFYIQ